MTNTHHALLVVRQQAELIFVHIHSNLMSTREMKTQFGRAHKNGPRHEGSDTSCRSYICLLSSTAYRASTCTWSPELACKWVFSAPGHRGQTYSDLRTCLMEKIVKKSARIKWKQKTASAHSPFNLNERQSSVLYRGSWRGSANFVSGGRKPEGDVIECERLGENGRNDFKNNASGRK